MNILFHKNLINWNIWNEISTISTKKIFLKTIEAAIYKESWK